MPPNFMEMDIQLRYGNDPEAYSCHRRSRKIPGVGINLGQFIAHRPIGAVRHPCANCDQDYGGNLDQLLEKGQQVEVLAGISGVRDLQLEQQIRVPEVRINVHRDRAARLG
jgi:Cu/Ag efflux pump CusA